MARITTISLRADVSKDCVSYIKEALRAENPKAHISVKAAPSFSLHCNIESDRNDYAFFVQAPMMERNLAARVNRLVNYHNQF